MAKPRCAAFGFIVEQVLTTKSRNAISLGKGRGVRARRHPGVSFHTEGTATRHPSSGLRRINAGSACAGLQFGRLALAAWR